MYLVSDNRSEQFMIDALLIFPCRTSQCLHLKSSRRAYARQVANTPMTTREQEFRIFILLSANATNPLEQLANPEAEIFTTPFVLRVWVFGRQM